MQRHDFARHAFTDGLHFVLARIHRLGRTDENRRYLLAVHQDGNRSGIGAAERDCQHCDARLQRRHFRFGRRLRFEKSRRRTGRNILSNDPRIRFAREYELTEPCARSSDIEQMRWRVHDCLGAGEKINRVRPSLRRERFGPFRCQGAGARAIFVGLTPRRCRLKQPA
jgi:hypothetical protein